MGIKTGYYYKCRKCETTLGNVDFFINALYPINFDYLVKDCYCCNTKYLTPNSNEFFTIKKGTFYKWLISSLIRWLLWIFIILGGICALYENYTIPIVFCILFIPIYIFAFKNKYNKAIQQSIKRFNDSSYIYDLLQFGILDFNDVTKFYNDNIISFETYNGVIYNIKVTNENNQQLEYLINKLEKENKTKEENTDEENNI